MDIKAKRISDGLYELQATVGKELKTVRAQRLPDLYFEIILDGVKHKGYLKDLKAKFAAWLSGLRDVTAVEQSRDEMEVILSPEESVQAYIDSAESRDEQIKRWVMAYNSETVVVAAGGTRHDYRLPPGPAPDPPLEECFHPAREQYIWPTPYDESMS